MSITVLEVIFLYFQIYEICVNVSLTLIFQKVSTLVYVEENMHFVIHISYLFHRVENTFAQVIWLHFLLFGHLIYYSKNLIFQFSYDIL